MRAVAYIRVSAVRGRGGDTFLSPGLQRESIERLGLDVVEWIEELDASGGDASRPGWNRAIEMVERGEADGVAVWNLARFSRSVVDALRALDRIEAAGGRVWSATEQLGDDPMGRFTRNMLLSLAQMERERARAGFAAATASAVERGIHVAGTIPYGYVRGPDRRLRVDPAAAPVVLGMFERRARGWSWRRLTVWAAEQGHEISDNGARDLIRNPAYLGQARYGQSVKEDAHEAIGPRGLWRKCQGKQRPSARTGRMTQRFLLQGLCSCAACDGTLYLTGGSRKSPYYLCRHRGCPDHAYAQAHLLDSFVLNVLEEATNPADPANWVPLPGDGREVEEAESALDEAREDLDSWLSDTKLRGVLGAERYAEATSDRVAVVNKAEADMEAARESAGGRSELVGRLWNTVWTWHERKEYVSRMIKSVVVTRGKEPLSERCDVALR